MNFGYNIYSFLVTQMQWIVLTIMVCMGGWFLFKRQTTGLIITLIVGTLAVVLAFNADGLKDLLLDLGNTTLGLSIQKPFLM